MGILANSVASAILFFFGIGTVLLALWLLFNRDIGVSGRVGAIVVGILAVFIWIGWNFSATHRVVPATERWVIVNQATGKVEGGVRKSGLTEKPLVLAQILRYPGVTDKLFCIDYLPALKEGYEVNATICGTYDASNVDWAGYYLRYNFWDESKMIEYWANQNKELVSAAFKEVDYTKIVQDRDSVSRGIRESLTPWYLDFGTPVKNIQLQNWFFTSAKVNEQVDSASAASMKKTVEAQLLEAAQVARERQVYEVETANLVLAERGKGLSGLFSSLGITDDNAKATIATQMTWYSLAQNPPANTQWIFGVGGIPIAAPYSINQPGPAPTEPAK